MDKEYLENLILLADKNIYESNDIDKVKEYYYQLVLRIVNHLDLDNKLLHD